MMPFIKLSSVHKPAALKVINDAAGAYKGVIPPDRWKEPYLSAEEFAYEINAGVRFYGKRI
jgi:hypothetical protein